MGTCIDLIRDGNFSKLLDWLVEDSIPRSSILLETLRNQVSKQRDVASFVCENATFLATGHTYKTHHVFNDDSLDLIATGLGHDVIHGSSNPPVVSLKDYIAVEGYHFDDFVDVLQLACDNVEPSLAFIAILDSLRSIHTNNGQLFILLEKIIKRCPDAAQRITTATATLSYVHELCTDVGPYLSFLRNMWMTEIHDAHNVSKRSLMSLALRMHTSIVIGKSKFEDAYSGYHLANLICCWESDMWSWISRICVYSSQTDLCALDTSPVDEALCCFEIFTNDISLMPRVYSIRCRAVMYLKVAHVLVSNIKGEHDDSLYKALTLSEAVIDMLNKSGTYGDFSTSPPAEFLGKLVSCCSTVANIGRLAKILDFFIQIITEDGRITLFDRILSQCNTDTAMFNCLHAFRKHLTGSDKKAHLGTIFVLKSTSRCISVDAQKFKKSLACVLAWVKALVGIVEPGSDASKLASDLYTQLRSLILDDMTNFDYGETLLIPPGE